MWLLKINNNQILSTGNHQSDYDLWNMLVNVISPEIVAGYMHQAWHSDTLNWCRSLVQVLLDQDPQRSGHMELAFAVIYVC